MRKIIILIIAITYILFGCPDYMSDSSTPYLLRALTYPLFHGNIAHLLANMLAVWMIYDPRRKHLGCELLMAAIISFIVYPISFVPVVGISNIAYATLGLRTPSFSSPWWKRPTTIVFLIVTLVMVFIPQFSALTHIAAFALGIGGAHIRRVVEPYSRDVRRFIR